MSDKCIVPDCDSTKIHLRKICRPCYLYASSLVRFGLTTWAKLEDSGCVGESSGSVQSPRRPLRVEWFSKATGLPPDMLAAEVGKRARADFIHRRIKTRRKPRTVW